MTSILALLGLQKTLMDHIPHGHKIPDAAEPSVIAGLGVVEETIEYLSTIGFKSWRPNPLPREDQLQELTDILFFYLELIVLSGFSWEEIVAEYHRKHAVNVARYKAAKKGDFRWDLRGKKEEL